MWNSLLGTSDSPRDAGVKVMRRTLCCGERVFGGGQRSGKLIHAEDRHHALIEYRNSVHELVVHVAGELRGRLDVGRSDRDDVGDRIHQQADSAIAAFDHDDNLLLADFSYTVSQPGLEID